MRRSLKNWLGNNNRMSGALDTWLNGLKVIKIMEEQWLS